MIVQRNRPIRNETRPGSQRELPEPNDSAPRKQ